MSQTNNCTCNDESQTKKHTCFNCEKIWEEKKLYNERVGDCLEHYSSVAFCGSSLRLCALCTEQGYYIKYTGHPFSGTKEVKQKEK